MNENQEKQVYTTKSFDWPSMKALLNSSPDLEKEYNEIELQAIRLKGNLKKEITFLQALQKIPEYAQLKAEFEKLLSGQKRRVQLALGFGGNLLDNNWGPRMYLVWKDFSFKNAGENYALGELSYTDEKGQKREEYVKIARKLAGKDITGIQKEINKRIPQGSQKIQEDGDLGPETFAYLEKYPDIWDEERKSEHVTSFRAGIPIICHEKEEPVDVLTPNRSRTFLGGNNFPNFLAQEKAVHVDKTSEDSDFRESILALRKQVGLKPSDIVKKSGDDFIILSQGGSSITVTQKDTDKYTLMKYIYGLEGNKMVSSVEDIKGLERNTRKGIENILKIKLLKLSAVQQYNILNQYEILKLFTVEELSDATIIDDDDFVSIFSHNGVKKGDIVSTTEEGFVVIFNMQSKKFIVKKDIKDFPVESIYEKFLGFKKEFTNLNPQEKVKLFNAFQIGNYQLTFKEFFLQIYTKPLFQTIHSLKDVTDLEGVKDISSLKKYGINAQIMKDLGVREGDFYRYDKAGKKLILFRGNNDGMKEEIGTDALIRIAFQSINIESIKNLVSLEVDNKQFIQIFKDLIRRDRVRARERLFFNIPLNLGPNAGNGRKINFYGLSHLKNIITPYDLFGDFQYLKMDGIIYKRAPENGDAKQEGQFEAMETLEQRVRRGDFYGNDGKKMKISSDGVGIITDIPNQETEAFEASFSLDTLIDVLEDIKGSSKKKEFITLIQSTIKKRNLFKQARDKFIGLTPLEKFASVFTLEKNKDIPQILKENLSIYDFFGDFEYIKIDGVVYKNDGISLFVDGNGNFAPKLTSIKDIQEDFEKPRFFDIIDSIKRGNFGLISNHYKTLPPEKREEVMKNIRLLIARYDLTENIQRYFLKSGRVNFQSDAFWESTIGAKEMFGKKVRYLKINFDSQKIYQFNGKDQFLNFYTGEKLELETGMVVQEGKNIQEELSYTPLARSLGRYTIRNFKFGRTLKTGTTGCGKGTGDTLTDFGIEGFTMGDFGGSRDGYKWKEVLDDATERGQFIKIKVNHPNEAKGGAVLIYDRGAILGTKNRRLYGHAEIKGEDGKYRHANVMGVPAGSAHTDETDSIKYRKLTGFTGYAYYPVRKTV